MMYDSELRIFHITGNLFTVISDFVEIFIINNKIDFNKQAHYFFQ